MHRIPFLRVYARHWIVVFERRLRSGLHVVDGKPWQPGQPWTPRG